MPSKTFLNLPHEKQEKIKLSAIKEFASVSFEKVSINKIVKDANISRGSFYMYFEDIYDLAIYLMDDSKTQIIENMQKTNVMINGKLDEIILEYHKAVFEYYNQESYRSFFKNFIVYFQGMPEDKMLAIKGVMKKSSNMNDIVYILDKTQFRDEDEDYIKHVTELGFVLFRNVMFQTFIKNLSIEDSRQLLVQYLKILKHGYGGCNNA